MKRHDVVVTVIVVVCVSALIYYFFYYEVPGEQLTLDETGPQALSVEDSIEESFQLEIPEDVEKVELQGTQNSKAIATRDIRDGVTELTILADLPDGEYHAALVLGSEGDDNFEILPLGNLGLAKGGYLIDHQSDSDLSEYNRIIVSSNPITSDIPEDLVFDGSF
ncbi:hypothetical protein ACFL2C_02985 [Patescibacteria group bacterium]